MTNVESRLSDMIAQARTPEARAGLIEIRNLVVEQRLDRESETTAPRRNRAQRVQTWWECDLGEFGKTKPRTGSPPCAAFVVFAGCPRARIHNNKQESTQWQRTPTPPPPSSTASPRPS